MQSSFTVQVIDMASYDPEDRLVNEVLLFVFHLRIDCECFYNRSLL